MEFGRRTPATGVVVNYFPQHTYTAVTFELSTFNIFTPDHPDV